MIDCVNQHSTSPLEILTPIFVSENIKKILTNKQWNSAH